MTKFNLISQRIGRVIGVPPSRVNNVARRLREAGILPAGGPGVTPPLDRQNVVALTVAVASGAKLDDVTEITQALLATVPGGADVSGAPLTIPRTAEIALAVLTSQALAGEDLDSVTIEVVHGWPEIALHWDDNVIQRFQALGTLTNHQPTDRSRIATRIPGAAFATLIRSI